MTITLVGDTDQMLYSWNGARSTLLTEEIQELIPDIQTIKLEINYRSKSKIIDACQRLIAYNYSDKSGPYSQEFMKNTRGVKDAGNEITYELLDTPEDEAQYIAMNIQAEIANDYQPGDFFVGARTRAQLAYLEGALFRANIKFINIASNGSFWQSRHVAALVDYLRLAHDQGNKDALKTVYNIPSNNHPYGWDDKKGRFRKGDYCPARYLGAEFLSKIDFRLDNIEHFLNINNDAWRYKTNDRDYWQIGPSKAQDLLEYVQKITEFISHCKNVGLMLQEINDTSVEKWLKSSEGISEEDSGNGKLDDLATVIEIASDYTDIDEFLTYVDGMVKASEDAQNDKLDEYVIISTYHRLKGLERPVVFGMGWCEGVDKNDMPVGLLPYTFSLREPPNFGILPGGGQSPIEDERAIGFVCISRAMDKVYLTGTRTYRNWVMWKSRFVGEMMNE